MSVALDHIVVWIIVGLLAGSLTGLVAKGEKRGFGLWNNLALGLAGAVVGGLLFRLLGLLPGLERVTISLRDVVAAFAGSLLVLLLLWWRGKSTQTTP
ncbi:GlsB/YeaQ/YmgE family stress response membrane protein [Hyphomicrobium sp.]|uniref:GlsB/YeaQ/YmgE family stress response membrane protein n=1 Tax=Hyphomicrobium sp. TaxID=82 RepID=UPI002C924B65|nr:GlsB/YeaQ/YmgE family stress response membrane protein [Hyphomicrobium sp.]HRN89901.1 GlsB/YeaQ/YmgE family stress response membrane protein [Hyphomicrobium sp.]HRQ27167.1 GlsB/YeaQ/YmgE family stress response membrane protein [Hyphomicrobium sp.]